MIGRQNSHGFIRLLPLLLLAGLLTLAAPGAAQDNPIPLAYTLAEYSNVYIGYIWDDGHRDTHSAGDLPRSFGFMAGREGERTVRFGVDWVLGSYALSPDKQQFAFSAFDPILVHSEDGSYTSAFQYGLFFYGLPRGELKQIDIKHPVKVIWSPDGKTLLLPAVGIQDQPEPFYFDSPDTLLFDIATETFSTLQVGDPPAFYVDGFDGDLDTEGKTYYASASEPFTWLPDGHLTFWSGGIDCQNDCEPWSDFYIANRDGSNVQRLTHLEEQLPPEIARYTNQAAWSPVDERLYMEMDAHSPGYADAIYSTDLQGNLREELLPGKDAHLLSLHPVASQKAVYVVSTRDNNWQLLQLTGSNETVKIIVELPNGADAARNRIYRADMDVVSPDDQYIAVSTTQYPYGKNAPVGTTEIIDLASGEVVQSIQTGIVCDLRWQDATHILYQTIDDAQPGFYCDAGRQSLYLGDIETGSRLEIYENRGRIKTILLP